jgi:NADH-quinone oxidoreductase subunit I
MSMLNKSYQGLKGLLSGLGLTLGYFVKPSKVITQQYPENRQTLKLPPRTRMQVELVKDAATGDYICNGCGVCVKACPNGSLEVVRGKDPVTKKNTLEKYVYHFERCTVCGLCVDACPTSSNRMGQGFENAVYESSQLTMILNADAIARKAAEAAKAPPAVETPAAPAKTEPTQPAAPAPTQTPKAA